MFGVVMDVVMVVSVLGWMFGWFSVLGGCLDAC
jgi:hypothetical protein